MGGCFLFVLFTGDWLMVLVFGEAYRGTGAILIVLTGSTLMHCLGTLAHNGLWAVDRPRSNFVADVCCLAVTLVVAALLIVPYGALGAAFATLAGITTAALVRSLTLLRYFETQLIEANLATNSALPT
jgi:O-antigen/teichoic acid export membrane protein